MPPVVGTSEQTGSGTPHIWSFLSGPDFVDEAPGVSDRASPYLITYFIPETVAVQAWVNA